MRILLLATLLVGLLVGLPLACNTTPQAQATERSGFTGTYSLVSIDGHPIPYAPMHEGRQAPEVVSSTLTLNSDGTFTSTMSYRLPDGRGMSRDFRGTYSEKGSDLNLEWEGAGQTTVTLDGSTLTMDNHGALFVYELLVARPDSGPPEMQTLGEMVLVPGGEFTMGSSPQEQEIVLQFDWPAQWLEYVESLLQSSGPAHLVYLDSFSIDKYEVTNRQYRKFTEATGHRPPALWADDLFNHPEQPVVGVAWHDAAGFCKWAGKRLPSEAEWEKAARGAKGLAYPWGNTWDPSKLRSADGMATQPLDTYDAWLRNRQTRPRDATTAKVGSYPDGASPYGVMDMAGNVWEWVADWYGPNYYAESPSRNPQGPPAGERRVLRGGAWDVPRVVALAWFRETFIPPENAGSSMTGFRCAMPAPVDAQNLLTNGSFENGDYSGGDWEHIPAGATDITGWAVGDDGIDWHNDGEMQFPQDGILIVNLNGSDGDSGSISQTFGTQAGQQYSLSFYLCGPGVDFPDPRRVQVDVAGSQQVFPAPASPNTALVWEQKEMTFVATGSSTTLAFSNVDPVGFWGPAIDNVRVSESAPVPTTPP